MEISQTAVGRERGVDRKRRGLTLHGVKLVRKTAAHTDIPHPPLLHHIVQRLHRLFDRRLGVKAVALQEIDIVELQSFQRGLDRVENVL